MQDASVCLRGKASQIIHTAVQEGAWPGRLVEPFIGEIVERVALHLEEASPPVNPPAMPAALRDSQWDQARVAAALVQACKAHLPEDFARDAIHTLRSVMPAVFPREPLNGQEQSLQGLREPGPEDIAALVLHALDRCAPLAWALTSPQGALLHLNPRAQELLGYRPSAVRAGLSIADLFALDSLREAERRLKAAAERCQSFAARLIDRSGSMFACQIHVQPLEGQHFLMVHIEPGVARLGESLGEALLKNAPMGIVVTDATGRVQHANTKAAALYGAPSAEALVGLPFHNQDGTPEAQAAVDMFAAVRDRASSVQHTFRFMSVFGKQVYFEATIRTVNEKPAAGIVLFLNDLHERQMWEDQVRQGERLPTLMGIIGGVAHELNNPLTTILGYGELLLQGELDSVVKSRLASIGQEAQRCRKIVENLQSFGLQKHLNKAFCDLNAVVREALELQEYQLTVDKIELELRLAPDLPQLLLQERAILRICLAIIANAHYALLQVHDRPRKFIVTTTRSDGGAHLIFQDTGCGMNDEVRQRSFEPFFTSRPRGDALGLGLSVAYGTVQEHQGRIWIDSTWNVGTSIHIEFPAPIVSR